MLSERDWYNDDLLYYLDQNSYEICDQVFKPHPTIFVLRQKVLIEWFVLSFFVICMKIDFFVFVNSMLKRIWVK